MKKLLGFILMLVACSAFADEPFAQCQDQFPGVVPMIVAPKAQYVKLQDICYDSFAVLYSGASKTPVISIEHLTADRVKLMGSQPRTNKFYADARIPSADRAELTDYAGAGYDRGHMSPAEDMPNVNAEAQCFTLANMVPQNPNNNRGPWKKLETLTRKYAGQQGGDVYVFSGPIYDAGHKTIGQNVWVPDRLFKLVYNKQKNTAFAWIVPNGPTDIPKSVCAADVTAETGIDFLHGIKVSCGMN